MARRHVILSHMRDDFQRGFHKTLEEYAQRGRGDDDKKKREKKASQLENEAMGDFWNGFEKHAMAAVVRKAKSVGRAGRRAAATPAVPPAAAPAQSGDFLVRQGQKALNWAGGTAVGKGVVQRAQAFGKANPNVAAVGHELGGIVRRNPVTTAALGGGVLAAGMNRQNS